MIILVCGVCGTGKTTIGQLLSEQTGLPFYDADDFHPVANKQKMGAGQPLSDQDRLPWLNALADQIAQWSGHGGGILACSALKESYRNILRARAGCAIHWIFLTGSEAILEQRLKAREGHFMGVDMLRSQLELLELPSYAWCYDVSADAGEIAASIAARLNRSARAAPAD